MRWPWPRKAARLAIRPESRSLRTWFTRATKDPFHQKERAKTRREFHRVFGDLSDHWGSQADEEDCF